ncbi:hypothetical protein P692DRAFT_201281141 [Suillus brevipes Sb2]|nr:hypothetical protein P692DRAFT_201281141 [Suillus brevipes Sb2]
MARLRPSPSSVGCGMCMNIRFAWICEAWQEWNGVGVTCMPRIKNGLHATPAQALFVISLQVAYELALDWHTLDEVRIMCMLRQRKPSLPQGLLTSESFLCRLWHGMYMNIRFAWESVKPGNWSCCCFVWRFEVKYMLDALVGIGWACAGLANK